jgi:secondary thiamine-phosphate synthase enzyme
VLFHQTIIRLKPRPRGFHLVTGEILTAIPEIARVRVGMLHLFLQHTSASLFLNENADPDVRRDFEHWSRQAMPDGAKYLVHQLEGPDDMPAHLKAGMFGVSQIIPVGGGQLLLGTWQGVYLGEHRDVGGSRTVVATLSGEE